LRSRTDRTESSTTYRSQRESRRGDREAREGAEPGFQLEPPSISLPKGGGAIKSIDEKFTVNPSNGTVTLSLPLPLTPARNGAVPPLRIAYDGGAGNGVVGLGWMLALPAIRRGTDRFIPRYDDRDVFMLAGSDELVPSLSWDGIDWNEEVEEVGELTVRRYRPRVDSEFSRIERIARDDGESWWRIMSRDNVTTFYGTHAGARVAEPDAPNHVHQWLPTVSFDDLGNCAVYEYVEEDLAGVAATASEANRRAGLARVANRYPKRIRYGNRTPYLVNEATPYEAAAPSDEFLFEAVLDYGDHDPAHPEPAPDRAWAVRDDPFSSYRAGFEIRTYRLLRRVLMFHRFDELNDGEPTLVRSLDLTYAASSPEAPEVTYLTAATRCGYILRPDGEYSKRTLPALEFDYQRPVFDTDVRRAGPETVSAVPAGVTGPSQWVDLYGEGIAGVFSEQEGAWLYASNLGDVDEPGTLRLDRRRLVMPRPSLSGVESRTLEFQDLDADGSRQVVVRSPQLEGYFELDDESGWEPFEPFPSALRVELDERHVRRLDLVGDGRADVLVYDDDAFVWYRSAGRRGFEQRERVPRARDEERAPEVVFADDCQAVVLADMSGDGLSDIVRIRNGEVSYWPNRGYGRFGPRVAMDRAPQLDHPERFDARHVRVADITGTGAADMLYLGRDGISAYLNLSGNGWSTGRPIAPVLPTARPADVSTTDLFGNGTTCIVWSSALPADREAPLRYIDLMGGSKPHLLRGYDNGLGKAVELSYATSTWHYLKDKSEGRPWVTRLPFPVQCVRRVETRDRVGGARRISTYRYHHGHYDHVEREFRGFGMVEQTDAEEFEHWARDLGGRVVDRTLHRPPVLTKTWFHTGADDGRPVVRDRLRDEHWDRQMQRAGFDVGVEEPELPAARIVAAPTADPGIDDPPRADHRRQALRGCRGMVLRQEAFALDGPESGATPAELRRRLSPYSVATHNCLIELVQPAAEDRFAVVTVKESEDITFYYDREPDDPRVEHTLNVKVDEYGNVLESATVAYARRAPDASLPAPVRQMQARTLVAYTRTDFTADAISTAHHRLRRPSRTSTYELTGLARSGPIHRLVEFAGVLQTSTEISHHDDQAAPPPGTVFRRLLSSKETVFYDASLQAALPLHQLHWRALPYESYELAYTDELLDHIFGARATAAVMAEGRYRHRGDAHWWVPSGRWEFLDAGELPADAQARFFAHVAQTDPFGSRTTLGYLGDYFLLQDRAVDAAGNETRVTDFDLRTLSPRRLVDPNDNVSEVLLDELGWVKATAVRGKGDEADDLGALTGWSTPAEDAAVAAFFAATSPGQVRAAAATLLGDASLRHVCDVHRYRATGGVEPPVIATIVREQHAVVQQASPVQVSFEYSNGSGRVELTKVPAEPGTATRASVAGDGTVTLDTVDTAALVPPQQRWLGTGRKVVDNKGSVVKEYEPFFSITHRFESQRELVEAGVTRIRGYDPIGRVVRLDEPDGTFSRTEYSAWATAEHDRNDTVLETRWYDERANRKIDAALTAAGKDPAREAAAATQTAGHAGTPFRRHLDPLGRPVLELAHAGLDAGNKALLHPTTYRRDMAGRPLDVTDARGNTTVVYRRDMRGAPARHVSADSGTRLTLANVMGDPLRAWDERSHELAFTYDDPLHRLTAKRVRGGDGPVPLDHVFELTVYGEDRPADTANNLRTRVALHYDTAGRVEQLRYDWKGNLLASSRRFATDYKSVPDWSGPDPDGSLEAESFDSACEYDALDRVVRRTVADGSVHEPAYNVANLLESVRVTLGAATEVVVKDIDYDEHGQRRRIVFGNDVTTEYLHDRETFRLVRLTSRGSDATVLQDLSHTYDPVGNLTHLVDAAVPTVWFANAMVSGESTYSYDPLYRLTAATGREHAGQVAFGRTDNYTDEARSVRHSPNDVLAWQSYTERYEYDGVGNIGRMVHVAPAGSGWTRDYNYAADSNRLLTTGVGAETYSYDHHPAHGFVRSMPHLSLMRHTFKDELAAVATQVVSSGTPETTWYVYDGDGTRLRKVTERAAAAGADPVKRFERHSVDGTEVEREYGAGGAVASERRTLQVWDDRERIATIETELAAGGAVTRRLIRYQGVDHLGSSRLETDNAGNVIGYELYHPFGTTAYQAVEKAIAAAAKRYRYTGMERDEESGLAYHSARYYVPWLGRWTAPDTHAEEFDGNRYAYVKNNPVVHRDRNGLFEEPVHGAATYRLALAAGFTPDDAAKIAIATAGMDHDVLTRPGVGPIEMVMQIWLGRTQEFHFPSQDQALARVRGDIGRGLKTDKDLAEFGRHLHSLEDVGFKEAPGPHSRSNDRALSPVFAIVGLDLASVGLVAAIEAGRHPGIGTAWTVGLTIGAVALIAIGLNMFAFALRAEGTGHPSYQTERGEWSSSFSTVADQAFQDPQRNTAELQKIYEELKRAAAARYGGRRPSDDVAARAAIEGVVSASDACNINNYLNQPMTDVLGNPAPSYAAVVEKLGRWAPKEIDVSLDRKRDWQYRPGIQACPVPAR
jgi:RHS repeat-associated protein